MSDQRLPALGWYQDPERPDSQRWWSGVNWTGHTRPDPDFVPPPGSRDGANVTSRGAQALMAFRVLPGLLLADVVVVLQLATGALPLILPFVLLALLPLVFWALCAIFVVADRMFLRDHGLDPPSPAYILVAPPIAYMVVRTGRVHLRLGQVRRSYTDTIVTLAMINLAVAAGIALPLLLH